MSTRSIIALKLPDDTYQYSYCHFDGYPPGVGRKLLEHWTEEADVQALLDEGAMSSLGSEIGEQHDFSDYTNDWCTFYGRDRGESDTPDGIVSDLGELDHGQEYIYVMVDGEWYIGADETTLLSSIDLDAA